MHRFGAISFSPKKSTTPTSVNHVTNKIWSSFLCFNVFERFWYHLISFFVDLPMVSDSFSWTNPPASTKSKSCFSGHAPVPTYWGQTLSNCEDSTQGFDFVELETWYNKKTWTEKHGVGGLDFVENAGADLTLVCDFAEASPPLFKLCIYEMPAPNPTTLIGERSVFSRNIWHLKISCFTTKSHWKSQIGVKHTVDFGSS